MSPPALAARGLRVEGPGGEALIDGVDLELRAGEVLALVGPSGAGKSLTALSLIALVPPPAHAAGGVVEVGGTPLPTTAAGLREVRGGRIGFVPQDPAAALDPVRRVVDQLAETLRAHAPLSRREAEARARALLAEMGVDRDDHPHRLSGGQRQRALIAMALGPGPGVLIADEPTASLDAPVRLGVLDLIDRRRRDDDLAVLLVSHDLAAVARIADRIAVMEGGRIVETGTTAEVLRAPGPRARALRGVGHRAAPRPPAPGADPVVAARGVARTFAGRRGAVRALDGVDLVVGEGEIVGLVGASGSGKTTLARLLVRLDAPTEGAVEVGGVDLGTAGGDALRRARRTVQMVFQDPYLSLDPRLSVGTTIAEPMAIHGLGGATRAARRAHRRERVATLLADVGLDPGIAVRRPAELSGGQRQRVALARALALEPRALVLDEPVSALDAATGARMIALLGDLRDARGLAYLLISHDLATVAAVADRVAVMHEGRIVEEGPPADLLAAPVHPATRALAGAAQALSLAPWA
ncbi:nickel ABC transporter ATP-binding protein NikE [Miltoncostaea oceani]|uniref:nickel ABC transporter ATP-binding protein NikE n=1 Tax=Miltoncostaea oceani TaxID=2843216 RepID=UPI001C3D7DCA|nr:ABC transporter ATP-binding protein [Miltoncostaea oceani]